MIIVLYFMQTQIQSEDIKKRAADKCCTGSDLI